MRLTPNLQGKVELMIPDFVAEALGDAHATLGEVYLYLKGGSRVNVEELKKDVKETFEKIDKVLNMDPEDK